MIGESASKQSKVHDISACAVDPTHYFTLSQVYEGLLLKMGEKGNDGAQLFTPREVIRVMVRAVDPAVGETVYDPCRGTGGFLAQSYEYMRDRLHIQTKRKLLDKCDLWCVLSPPAGVFTAAGARVKTNLLFFTKGRPTEQVWYYDLSDVKVR